MSPRRTILRELARVHGQHDAGASYKRPSEIPGFADQPEKYQRAVNELLRSRMVEGRKDPAGHMIIALNAHRLRDVERAIRPVWTRPVVWAVLVLALAMGAALSI